MFIVDFRIYSKGVVFIMLNEVEVLKEKELTLFLKSLKEI